MYEIGLSDEVVKSTYATIQKGAFRADGKLWIADEQLHFSPFNKDLGYGPYHIPLADIKGVSEAWGKGAGIIPVTSNAIKVDLVDGKDLSFILSSPKDWVKQLS